MNTISDIGNLVFFDKNGVELQMQKDYAISWEIVPCDLMSNVIISNPKGHFILNQKNEVEIIVDDGGQFVTNEQNVLETTYNTQGSYTCVINDNDEISKTYNDTTKQFDYDLESDDIYEDVTISGLKDILFFNKGYVKKKLNRFYNPLDKYSTEYTYSDERHFYNKVIITFSTYDEKQSQEFPLYQIFDEDEFVADATSDTREVHFGLSENEKYTIYKLSNDNFNGESSLRLMMNPLIEEPKTYSVEFKNNYDYDLNIYYYSKDKSLVKDFKVSAHTTETFDVLQDTYIYFDKIVPLDSLLTADNLPISLKTSELQISLNQSIETSATVQPYGKPNTEVDDIPTTITDTIAIVKQLIYTNLGQHSMYYPYVKYTAVVHQDNVSVDFVAADTIIILEKDADGNYHTPNIEDDKVNYSLYFEFQKDSEMRFISSDTTANIIWNKSCSLDLQNEEVEGEIKPLYFTVGFTAKEEGCYQNALGMFIKEKTNDGSEGRKFFIGLIMFKTEVEGEDERFRTLLGNFGTPDPVKYPNIFKEQDPMEEGVDYTLINKKSKELMVYYEQIFPYVGTYKALMNAIKFLGYTDLVFKEWYRIKDADDRDKFVAIQKYDFEKGESLKSKLKRANVRFGEFERYKKLNRLAMIYHLNDIDYNRGEDDASYRTLDLTTKEWSDRHSDSTDVPCLKRIYDYRTDEILAKLYSVKKWLETYILGVNCYISDITGEYIILERMKTQGYVNEIETHDFTMRASSHRR